MNRIEFEYKLLKELNSIWQTFTLNLPINYDVEEALKLLIDYGNLNQKKFEKYVANNIQQVNFLPSIDKEPGMNSPGILWDRLTILNCKMFFTSPNSPHFSPIKHSSNFNINLEIDAVLYALNTSNPAMHILLAKEATQRQDQASDLGILLWQLQSANLAMWINQDLLYTVNVDSVDEKRLRNYIKFFAEANKIRNTAIEKIEIFYTQILK